LPYYADIAAAHGALYRHDNIGLCVAYYLFGCVLTTLVRHDDDDKDDTIK